MNGPPPLPNASRATASATPPPIKVVVSRVPQADADDRKQLTTKALIVISTVFAVGAISFMGGLMLFAAPAPSVIPETQNDATPVAVPVVVAKPAPVVPLPAAVELVPSAAPAKPVVRHVLVKTPVLGSMTGGGPYQKLGLKSEPLLGFRVEPARWFNHSIIRTLDPIFASDNVVVTDSMILPRQGYAVGGVVLDGDQDVRAMRIVFMRIKGDGLDKEDTYQTDWIGEATGKTYHILGCNGDRVVGIYGRRGLNQDALGLILRETAKPVN